MATSNYETVTIPTTSNPFRVIVNGVEYKYEAGATVEVPPEVAAAINASVNAAADLVKPGEVKPPFGASGGSIPKPLSYDFMPEGYPKVATEDEVILEATEFEIEKTVIEGTNIYSGFINTDCELEHGEIYTIYYDGIGYECEAWGDGSNILAGNLDGTTGGSSTPPSNSNAPFRIILYNNGVSVRTFTLDSVGFHTLSITHHKREVTRMSPEFLPEGGGLVVEIDWDNNTVITPLDAIAEAWLKRIPMVIYDEGDGYCTCYYFSGASGYYGSFQSAEFTRMYRDYNGYQVMRVDSLFISSDGSVNIENYRFEHDEAAET